MKITCLSLPYVYPLCPLNMNHAKMFVIADVYARYEKLKNAEREHIVIFPVASHFSGNTAHATANDLNDYFIGNKNEKNAEVYNLYKNIYNVPSAIIKKFVNPQYLMNYFHSETLWELKSLGVSCDYEYSYTTRADEFSCFVRSIIKQYENLSLLILNKSNELAINYDDTQWREATQNLIDATEIKEEFQKSNILSAFKNLSGEWELLRNTGYGVEYNSEGWIIDPMFDSELLTVFDLFFYWRQSLGCRLDNSEKFFSVLLLSLKENRNLAEDLPVEEKKLIDCILESLPCDIFFGEEHLKNWIGKKFFAEEKLLHSCLRTRQYRILGMGMLDGKRMSASKGHAVLSSDLIKEFGGEIARLIILMTGGNISKTYNYEKTLSNQAKKMMRDFTNYWIFLNSNYEDGTQTCDVEKYEDEINQLIEDGYIRKAVTYLLVSVPAQNKYPDIETIQKLKSFYSDYLKIFLPEFSLCQMQ